MFKRWNLHFSQYKNSRCIKNQNVCVRERERLLLHTALVICYYDKISNKVTWERVYFGLKFKGKFLIEGTLPQQELEAVRKITSTGRRQREMNVDAQLAFFFFKIQARIYFKDGFFFKSINLIKLILLKQALRFAFHVDLSHVKLTVYISLHNINMRPPKA